MKNISLNVRQLGKIIAVNNFRIKVLLDEEIKSQVRAFQKRTGIVTQNGSYLLFPVAPEIHAVGIIVGAAEDEAIEPDFDKEMTLQLTRSRRILQVNLLGQLLENKPFETGVSVYPTLETPALFPTEEELKSILEFVPKKKETDNALSIGVSPIYARQEVTVSYNDLLGRPFGIIGNTGSGKSYSVASILQSAIKKADQSKFIILDINGEYSKAFKKEDVKHELNNAYIDGKGFNLPVWIFNLNENIAFFGASESSQTPVLERVITAIREDTVDQASSKLVRNTIRLIDRCLDCLGSLSVYSAEVSGAAVSENVAEIVVNLIEYANLIEQNRIQLKAINLELHENFSKIKDFITPLNTKGLKTKEQYKQMRKASDYDGFRNLKPDIAEEVIKLIDSLEPCFQATRQDLITKSNLKQVTADSPIKFDIKNLEKDALFHIAVSRYRGQERIQEYIATLRLRIHRQLSDKRWSVFSDNIQSFKDIIDLMVGNSAITVVDCSMLSYDVLPFFCAIFGRILLELRVHSSPEARTCQPYVLILEEAHNYLKPHRENESFGVRLSRETFERIAKEGRKFGLSLIIASQRPADVSTTVLSQCANFLVHRIQNPEDIDYFKRILPSASRDLLDQLPILAPGNALVLGSAVNVPARVKIKKPQPEPISETPKPWLAWQKGQNKFDLEKPVSFWINETYEVVTEHLVPPKDAGDKKA